MDINQVLEQGALNESMIKTLILQAIDARKRSYTPYSHFKVGAALLCGSGEIYQGCNIENAGFTATNCAERTAFFRAVSEGKYDFKAIAIVGGKENTGLVHTAPCGVCRQVMMEFCDYEKFLIILATDTEHFHIYTLKELLPEGFGPKYLNE